MTPTPLSVLEGGPAPELDLDTLPEALTRAAAAETSPSLVFVAHDGSETSTGYRQLLDDASRILAALRACGGRPGEKVILQIDQDPLLLTAFWGCLLGGFVPMPVAAGSSPAQREAAPGLLHRVWTGYGRPRVITGPAVRIAPETATDPHWDGAHLGRVDNLLAHEPDHAHHRAAPDDPAALLLTSGSTGVPKAVTLTHRNILSRSAATALVNGLGPRTRTFNWMPLDHVGGLVMFHARDVYLGCHQVHARTEWITADPLRWLASIDRHRADTTWAPNFAFGLINDRAEQLAGRDWDLSCLRYIMNGGEAVHSSVVRTFLGLLSPFGLPQTAMYPGWGMSETSAGVADCQFTAVATGEERYVPVGRPQPGTSVRVVDEHDRPVPVGTTGYLHVTGASVTSGYHDNPEHNRRSFTDDGWFRTGDLAYVRDGILTVTGRADDVLAVGGTIYHGHEIEAVVEELDFVEPTYTVAGAVTADGGGEAIAVFFHPRTGTADDGQLDAVRAHVLDTLGVRVRHVVPVAREDVPKTGIGKLRRAQLAQRFEAEHAADGTTRTAAA
ncbi:AMP-binding protein [Streptomyces sp. NPDC018964]|uniref:AMP-binding protein n=1 Tax=unclassified Streptomyces TaxID=2593676 RepID=UPI00379A4847